MQFQEKANSLVAIFGVMAPGSCLVSSTLRWFPPNKFCTVFGVHIKLAYDTATANLWFSRWCHVL